VDAIAKAAGLPPSEIRRAVMLAGAAPPVARAALLGKVLEALAQASAGAELGRV